MAPEPSATGRPENGPDSAAGPAVCGGVPVFAVFPAAARSVPAVRGWVRQQLRWRGVDGDVARVAQLLVSELATNAIQHTSTALVEVELSVGRAVEVRVHDDDSSGHPHVLRPGPDDIHGRGLAVVDTLAQEWAISPTATGKVVWFRLDLPPDPD